MLNFNSIPYFNTYLIEVFMNDLLIKKVGSGGVPYMTKKHFIVLADELAHDKFYYDSIIAYQNFYIGEKSHFCTWKKRDIPKWYKHKD